MAGGIGANARLQPPVSPFGSVDPAPPAPETELGGLRARLLDASLPLFERFQAIFGLRNLKGPDAALALGSAMRSDPSALLRHECAYVLGQMQQAAAVPDLVAALRGDENPMVRHEAAEALGACGGEEIVPELERALREDPATEVRDSCHLALEHFRYLRDPARF